MRRGEVVVRLPDGPEPLFLRLARSLSSDIARGRLLPGQELPGTRTLALQLGVHRNTVLAAYGELTAEGWLEARPAGATRVCTRLPEVPPRRFAPGAAVHRGLPERTAFPLGPPTGPGEPPVFSQSPWASAVPDVRLVPTTLLARALRRALSRPRRLDYGDANGDPLARTALAQLLSTQRGLAVGADDVFLTQGSQHAVDLLARTLVRPGDVVAVEALGYGPARGAFVAAGARLLGVPVDREGLDVAKLAGRGVRAVYLTPHHHYPTTVTLCAERRLALLELARRERFAIIEDDYDHEFHYQGRPVLPLASADTAGSVVYVGTLSKVLAPGVRLGFVVAPRPLVERLAVQRLSNDRQGATVLEAAVGELLDDGSLGRHVRKMRRVYAARRDAALEALQRHLGDAVRVVEPRGGMALWLTARPGLDVDAWAARAARRGVGFPTQRHFSLDGSSGPGARLAFAASTEAEFLEAARALARALRDAR
jgi:GntR family transcriptional regulator/MocR family aminotransferase